MASSTQAPSPEATARNNGKTEQERQAEFEAYYVQDEERTIVPSNKSGPDAVPNTKAKRAPRKSSMSTTKSKSTGGSSADKSSSGSSINRYSGVSSTDKSTIGSIDHARVDDNPGSSPLVRKSGRVAKKRKTFDPSYVDEDEASGPMSTMKPRMDSFAEKEGISTKRKTQRKASKSSDSGYDEAYGPESPTKYVTPSAERKLVPAKRKAELDGGSSLPGETETYSPPVPKKSKITAGNTTDVTSAKTTKSVDNISKAATASEGTSTRAKPTDISSAASATADGNEVDFDEGTGDSDAEAATKIKSEEREPEAKGKSNAESKGKGKARTLITDGKGTSIAPPADATLAEPWRCGNRDCNSGQTWLIRDGANSYGRKVISNFFGRNKKETNIIDKDVWHTLCRKDYQTQTYAANNDKKAPGFTKVKFYADNIETQLDRIELWRPEATFTVQLTKGANDRLAKFAKELRKPNATQATATAAVTHAPATNNQGKSKPLTLEDAYPIDRLEYLDNTYINDRAQTFEDLKAILAYIRDLAQNGHISSMPPIEFLISEAGPDEPINDPKANYDRWCQMVDGVGHLPIDNEDPGSVQDDRKSDAGIDGGDTASRPAVQEDLPTPTYASAGTQMEAPWSPNTAAAEPEGDDDSAEAFDAAEMLRLNREGARSEDGSTGSVDEETEWISAALAGSAELMARTEARAEVEQEREAEAAGDDEVWDGGESEWSMDEA